MELKNTLGPWLGKTTKMLACLINETFQQNNVDLTREQWIFLVKLSYKDGIPQNELAFITERDKTSLTRIVKTMERKELIERKVATADKRSKFVYLTEKGRTVFKNTQPIMQKTIQQLQSGLTEEEIKNTIEILRKFQKRIIEQSANCGIYIKK